MVYCVSSHLRGVCMRALERVCVHVHVVLLGVFLVRDAAQ